MRFTKPTIKEARPTLLLIINISSAPITPKSSNMLKRPNQFLSEAPAQKAPRILWSITKRDIEYYEGRSALDPQGTRNMVQELVTSKPKIPLKWELSVSMYCPPSYEAAKRALDGAIDDFDKQVCHLAPIFPPKYIRRSLMQFGPSKTGTYYFKKIVQVYTDIAAPLHFTLQNPVTGIADARLKLIPMSHLGIQGEPMP